MSNLTAAVCNPIDLRCFFLGEAVLGINPQLEREVTKEEAFEHLRNCQDAGLLLW